MPQSDLVLLWGTNTLTANPHLWPFVLKARENGARIIAIDPLRTRTADQCDEWIGIRPGTDAALALGMMHVIFAEGLQDDDYLARYTLGATELRERAREYPPSRVASITGIAEERIRELARAYGRAKAGVHAHQLRTAAPRRRRDGRPHDRMPPRGDGTLASRGRRRSALDQRELPVQQARARASRSRSLRTAHQHDPPRRGAHATRRGRRRTAGEGARRVQLESRRRRARQQRGAARARARGPVHGRARALPDRHRRLGRLGAARDDAARALGRALLVRPSVRHAQPARHRADGRGETEQRDLPAARGPNGDGPSRDAGRRRHAHPPGARHDGRER